MVKYHVIEFQGKVDDPTGDVEEGPGVHMSDGITRYCRVGIWHSGWGVKYLTQSNNSISQIKSRKVLDAISLF